MNSKWTQIHSNIAFWWEGRTEVLREKPLRVELRTNKLSVCNVHVLLRPSPGIETGTHWGKVSTFTILSTLFLCHYHNNYSYHTNANHYWTCYNNLLDISYQSNTCRFTPFILLVAQTRAWWTVILLLNDDKLDEIRLPGKIEKLLWGDSARATYNGT